MTAWTAGFRAVVTRLWLRLVTIATVTLLVAVTPLFPPMVHSWRFYQSIGDVVSNLAVRVVFVALAGVVLGTLCMGAVAPFLIRHSASREAIARKATRCAVGVAVFAVFLTVADKVASPLFTPIFKWVGLGWFPLTILYIAAFALALCIPRRRGQIVTSLDGFLGEKATRRAVIATGLASAGLAAAELTIGKLGTRISAAGNPSGPSRRRGPNVLLVTFDALSAEDMSLYGYRIPTTPHIDDFARRSTVFSNCFSTSTFTTPCVASLLTGLYPSEHRVYHLQGRLREDCAAKTLPRVMRAAGYATGASISNPYANFLAEALDQFDYLPDPAYRTAGFDLWPYTRFLHQHQPYGSRIAEFTDLEILRDYLPTHLERLSPELFARTTSGFSPAASFAQARQVLNRLPDDGFFMWVHVFAPHGPYLPEAPWMGKLLPRGELMSVSEQDKISWGRYRPAAQPAIDKIRLRYDEFIQEADSAFGSFLSDVERAGRLRNTAVMVSADHGESFEGGLHAHSSDWQTRPEIHIPLAIRMPGQQDGRRIGMTLDQTALAPTLLDIASLPRPDWMRGPSLLPLLKGISPSASREGSADGLAFTQYLAKNSVFKPVNSGTIGVIDGSHQYVVNLSTGAGMLRGLAEAHICDLDRSAENPALAQNLRAAIYSRFPELPRKQA